MSEEQKLEIDNEDKPKDVNPRKENQTSIVFGVVTLLVTVFLAFLGSNSLTNLTAGVTENKKDIEIDRTLIAIYKTDQSIKYDQLISTLSETKQPLEPTVPNETPEAIVESSIQCPWDLSAVEISKEFIFDCPNNTLIISSGDDQLTKRNGYAFVDFSEISTITFSTLIKKMPNRNDFLSEENYEFYVLFANYSDLIMGADILNYSKFRLYPVNRTDRNNEKYWDCCGLGIEDKLAKTYPERTAIDNVDLNTIFYWQIIKTEEGYEVNAKLPNDPYWSYYGVIIKSEYFEKPALVIGYLNPIKCVGESCRFEVVITITDVEYK